MIKINIVENDKIVSLIELNGHANYASSGSDIVCSGVTTATYTTINLLDRLDKTYYQLEVKDPDGYLKLTINNDLVKVADQKTVKLIIDNLIDMYKMLEEDYPKNLKINYRRLP